MIVARTPAELAVLGPGHYVGIGWPSARCWVTHDDPVVVVQRRLNNHKMDPDKVPLRQADLDALRDWLAASLEDSHGPGC